MGGAVLARSSDVDDRRPHRGRALRPDDGRALVAPPPARHRGVQALRARRRPELPPAAAQLAVDLLVEHGGGTADAGVTDVDRTTDARRHTCSTSPSRRALVGVDYPRERVVGILRDLGCAVDETGEGTDDTHVLVTPPSWRPDLVDAPDYAEEVARIDGYDNIPSITPTPSDGPRPDPRAAGPPGRRRRAGRGAGFDRGAELPVRRRRSSPTSSMLPGRRRPAVTRSGWPTRCPRSAPLLRTSVLSSLVDALRRNVARGHKDVAIFELGLVFRPGRSRSRTAPVPGVDRPPRRRDARAAVCRRARPAASRGHPRDRPGGAGRVVGSRPGRRLERHGRGGADRGRRARRAGRRRPTTPATRRGTRVGARGSRSPTARSSATPVSCTPRRSPRSTCRRAPWRPSSTSTCSSPRAREPVAGPRVLDLPAGHDRRRAARRRPTWPPPRSRRALRSGAGDSLESVVALRRLRGRAGRGGAPVAGLPPHLPGAGPDPDDRRGQRFPRRRGGGCRRRRRGPSSADRLNARYMHERV